MHTTRDVFAAVAAPEPAREKRSAENQPELSFDDFFAQAQGSIHDLSVGPATDNSSEVPLPEAAGEPNKLEGLKQPTIFTQDFFLRIWSHHLNISETSLVSDASLKNSATPTGVNLKENNPLANKLGLNESAPHSGENVAKNTLPQTEVTRCDLPHVPGRGPNFFPEPQETVQAELPTSRENRQDMLSALPSKPLLPPRMSALNNLAAKQRAALHQTEATADERSEAAPTVGYNFTEELADQPTLVTPAPKLEIAILQNIAQRVFVSALEIAREKTSSHEAPQANSARESSFETYVSEFHIDRMQFTKVDATGVEQQLEVRANNIEIGTVQLRVQASEQAVRVQITVQSKQLQAVLEQHRAQLQESLQPLGIELTSLSVELDTTQTDQNNSEDPWEASLLGLADARSKKRPTSTQKSESVRFNAAWCGIE